MALLLFPSVMPTFALRYYEYKAVWAPVLAAFTLMRYVGDSALDAFRLSREMLTQT